jgi:hypothetical protein
MRSAEPIFQAGARFPNAINLIGARAIKIFHQAIAKNGDSFTITARAGSSRLNGRWKQGPHKEYICPLLFISLSSGALRRRRHSRAIKTLHSSLVKKLKQRIIKSGALAHEFNVQRGGGSMAIFLNKGLLRPHLYTHARALASAQMRFLRYLSLLPSHPLRLALLHYDDTF